MKNQPYSNYIKLDGMDCHARKGWRGFSRPRGTNKRRRLIPMGASMVPLSRANRVKELLWSPVKSAWGRARAMYTERMAVRAAQRETDRIAAVAAAALEAAAAKAKTLVAQIDA